MWWDRSSLTNNRIMSSNICVVGFNNLSLYIHKTFIFLSHKIDCNQIASRKKDTFQKHIYWRLFLMLWNRNNVVWMFLSVWLELQAHPLLLDNFAISTNKYHVSLGKNVILKWNWFMRSDFLYIMILFGWTKRFFLHLFHICHFKPIRNCVLHSTMWKPQNI